jgi:hypothetical protein
MKKGFTYISVILDRSSSMTGVRDSMISGFNEFLSEQKKHPGEAVLTLTQFSTPPITTTYANRPLKDVPELTRATYEPAGMTALLDAVGSTIDGIGKHLAALPEAERPENVIVLIITDGMENSSREYKKAEVAKKIEHQTKKYGWTFVYIGANQDAYGEAAGLNIPVMNVQNYVGDQAGTSGMMRGMSNNLGTYRSVGAVAVATSGGFFGGVAGANPFEPAPAVMLPQEPVAVTPDSTPGK